MSAPPKSTPRARRFLLKSAALTSTALLLWCKKTPDREPIVYGNPKGPTHDVPPQVFEAGADAGTEGGTSNPGADAAPRAPVPEDASAVKQVVKDAGKPDTGAVVPVPTRIPLPGNPKGSMHDRGSTSRD